MACNSSAYNDHSAMKTTVDRRAQIIELIQNTGKVQVKDLSKTFGVSDITIRKDLGYLEKKGFLFKTRGGALSRIYHSGFPAGADSHQGILNDGFRVGLKAAEMIKDGDHILLDSYTHFASVAQTLSGKKNLTVMTNSVSIALKLRHHNNLEVMLTGGELSKESGCLLGPEAEASVRNHYFDKLFLGVDGLDIQYGLTIMNPIEARLNRIMLRRAKQIIVIATLKNFGQHSLSHICNVDDVNTIITDQISDQFQLEFSRRKIHVISAS